MKMGGGKFLPQNRKKPEILDDESVNRILPEIIDIPQESVQIMIVKSDVQGAEKLLHRIFFFQLDDTLVLVLIKIVRLYAQGKTLEAYISRIGSVSVGIRELLDIAGRTNKFHFLAPSLISLQLKLNLMHALIGMVFRGNQPADPLDRKMGLAQLLVRHLEHRHHALPDIELALAPDIPQH